jgi:hypothetical protein
MAQTTLISSIERSVYYPTEYILSSPYRCGTFSLIVDTGTWTEQMYYELPCLQLDIYTTISGVDVKYLSCNITLDTDNPMEPYTVSLYEVPETFKVKLIPGFDNDAVTSHKALCNQLNIPNTWVEETTDFNCELIWDNDNIKSGNSGGGGGETVDEVARSSIATHTSRTDNPHTVTKAQVGLSDVVNVDTTTTSNITDSTDKRFVSDAQKVVLENTSGANTGDETNSTIKTKLGPASTTTDGYLAKEDFATFAKTLNGVESGSTVNISDAEDNVYFNNIVIEGQTTQKTYDGVQMLNVTLTYLKTINTTGSWINNTYTLNGLNYEIITNQNDCVMEVKVSGIGTLNTNFYLRATGTPVNPPAGHPFIQ